MRQHTKNLPTNILNLKKSFVHLHSPLFLKKKQNRVFQRLFLRTKTRIVLKFCSIIKWIWVNWVISISPKLKVKLGFLMISKGTKMSYVAKIWLKMEVEFCNNPLNKQSNKVNAYHGDVSFWWTWDDWVKCNRHGAPNDIC